jgi:response regulator RpfG family c-di-GMP phosphodiesterase
MATRERAVEQAQVTIERAAGSQFDPRVVEAYLAGELGQHAR